MSLIISVQPVTTGLSVPLRNLLMFLVTNNRILFFYSCGQSSDWSHRVAILTLFIDVFMSAFACCELVHSVKGELLRPAAPYGDIYSRYS